MSVQKAIFPGLIIGIFFMVFMTSLLTAHPGKGQASDENASALAVEAPVEVEEAPVEEVAFADLPAEELTCTIGASYPESIRQWCELIERYARENGLDPNLVSAVMLQESAGQPDAYSKSGAVGLLQVMPRDGKAAGFMCKNGPCFSDRPSMQELFDPEFNVAYGTQMLAGLIAKTGDVREALRSYGPMDVGYYYADLVLGIMNSHLE